MPQDRSRKRWAVLQGLNSTDGDVTSDSQKCRSALGKTGFKVRGEFLEAASTRRKVQTEEQRIDVNRGTYLKEG